MRLRIDWRSISLALLALAALAGCSDQETPAPAGTQGVQLRFHLAEPSGVQAQYVSAGTGGVSLQVGQQAPLDYILPVPTCSGTSCSKSVTESDGALSSCTRSATGVSCTLEVPLPPGTYALTVVTYAQKPNPDFSGDTPLSEGTLQVTVLPGQTNQLSLTLGAVVASAGLTPRNSNLIYTSSSSGTTNYDIAAARSVPETFLLTLYDASGQAIPLGSAGAPEVTLCAVSPQELQVAPAGSPGQYVLQALHSFGSQAQRLYLAEGSSCTGPELDQYDQPVPIPLPTITETQALFVSNSGLNSSGTGYYSSITAYTAHGNPLSFQVSGAFSLGSLAFNSQTGWLYAVLQGSPGSVAAYLLPSGTAQTLASPIASLNYPGGLAFNPATGWLYVATENSSSGNVDVYGARTGAPVSLAHPITTSQVVFGMAIDPVNGQLYVANNSGSGAANTVSSYDAVSGAVVPPTITQDLGSPSGVAFDPYNGQLYVTNQRTSNFASTVTSYVAQSGQEVTLAQPITSSSDPTLSGPDAIAFDLQDRLLYVVNLHTETVQAYQPDGALVSLSGGATSGGAIATPTSSGFAPNGIAIVP